MAVRYQNLFFLSYQTEVAESGPLSAKNQSSNTEKHTERAVNVTELPKSLLFILY